MISRLRIFFLGLSLEVNIANHHLWPLLSPLWWQCLVRAQDYYDPVWSGRGCREDERVDVGRGGGSCHTDCDCPLCAPYCSTSGFCQNHQRAGRRKIPICEAQLQTSLCCNKNFTEGNTGDVSAQDYYDLDYYDVPAWNFHAYSGAVNPSYIRWDFCVFYWDNW